MSRRDFICWKNPDATASVMPPIAGIFLIDPDHVLVATFESPPED